MGGVLASVVEASVASPALGTITDHATLRLLAYALCHEHAELSLDDLDDLLLPGWREQDVP